MHLENKETNCHSYYGSLVSLRKENDIGVSIFTLQRHNFDISKFENSKYIIRKGNLKKSKNARL